MQPNLQEVERIIAVALAEDVGAGDATTLALVPADKKATAKFVTRQKLTVCGLSLIPLVFHTLSKEVICVPQTRDGVMAEAGAALMEVSGPARAVLTGERVALNLLQRMCGVAAITRQFVDAVDGTQAVILDTRKTMPGLRELDKYAVRMGGGQNHRMRLDDAILIKDNHVALAGGIAQAVALARKYNSQGLMIEVECDTLQQVKEALALQVDRIMLDNMAPALMSEIVKMVAGKVPLEASGGVTLKTVRAIAETGVDYISVGALTHSAPSVDIGLDIKL